MRRGITKERDQEIQGKLNRRKKGLSLGWFILGLGTVILVFFTPRISVQKIGGDIRNAIAIVYNEKSEKCTVTGTLVRRDRDIGHIVTVAGVCITENDEGSEIKLWLPSIGDRWLIGKIKKIHSATEITSESRLSPNIALIEIALHGIKNQPVPLYNSEPEQVKGQQAEVWKIDLKKGDVETYTAGTISAFSAQRSLLVLNAELQEHMDGAPVVLKSKERNKYVLLGILPELLSKTSNQPDTGRVNMEEAISFFEIKKMMNEVLIR